MATYEVTTPAGKFRITAPDDYTPDQISEVVRAQFGGQSSPAGLDPNVPKPPSQAPAQAQPRPDVNTTMDVAKSAGAGLVRGGLGLVGLPGSIETLGRAGINAAAGLAGYENPVSPENVLPSGADLEKRAEGAIGPLYKPQTTAGEYARTIGEFAPGLAFPGGMVQRVVGNVLAPAVASETAGQMTEGTSAEPYARMAGAVAGAFAPGLASRVVSPVTQTPERARQAAIMDAEGVRLTAGQRTGNKRLQVMEQVAAETPLSVGTNTVFNQQAEDFTQAALGRVGENARRATPEVIDNAFNRIGAEFDRVAQNYDLPPSPPMLQQIANSVQDYADLVPASERAPIVANIARDIVAAYQGGQNIPGATYQAWRSRLTRLARNSRADPQLQDALLGLRNSLDDGMAAVMTPDDAAAWEAARNQFRNMVVVEKAATRGGEAAAEGILSPAGLRGAAVPQNQRAYARGEGDFGELARAGNATMTSFPNSGTPARLQAQWGFGALGSAGGAMAGGGPGAVAGALASPLLQALSASAFMSRPVQGYLANQLAVPMRNAINARGSVVASSPQLLDLYDQAQNVGPTEVLVGPRNPLTDLLPR
jgi:hypothetical protein